MMKEIRMVKLYLFYISQGAEMKKVFLITKN